MFSNKVREDLKGDLLSFAEIAKLVGPENGYQVKFSLEFPSAPSGTIESLNLFAMAAIVARDPEVHSITYGTGATGVLVGGRNLRKAKLKLLKNSYAVINTRLSLTNKTEYREKLGASVERVYAAGVYLNSYIPKSIPYQWRRGGYEVILPSSRYYRFAVPP
ncbi:hypothetical protein V502_02836 [Pseudogymnoascus sp. VKM F-4520 (FW-2644)]|nr:hypothetical protein V502_02836 [Pseudogymnoascus sp. VKM F-4520 (FW-2644)]